MFYHQGFVEIHGKIPALRKSIHGIAQEIEQDLPQASGIAMHNWGI